MYCNKEKEVLAILDEMVGAAVSMQSGAQSYDSFIKARDLCVARIHETFDRNKRIAAAIQELTELVE